MAQALRSGVCWPGSAFKWDHGIGSLVKPGWWLGSDTRWSQYLGSVTSIGWTGSQAVSHDSMLPLVRLIGQCYWQCPLLGEGTSCAQQLGRTIGQSLLLGAVVYWVPKCRLGCKPARDSCQAPWLGRPGGYALHLSWAAGLLLPEQGYRMASMVAQAIWLD